MRISTDETDAGFRPWLAEAIPKYISKIELNGHEMRRVVTADDTDGAGFVIRNRIYPNGDLVIDEARDEVVRETFLGIVVIHWTDAGREMILRESMRA